MLIRQVFSSVLHIVLVFVTALAAMQALSASGGSATEQANVSMTKKWMMEAGLGERLVTAHYQMLATREEPWSSGMESALRNYFGNMSEYVIFNVECGARKCEVLANPINSSISLLPWHKAVSLLRDADWFRGNFLRDTGFASSGVGGASGTDSRKAWYLYWVFLRHDSQTEKMDEETIRKEFSWPPPTRRVR